MRPFQLCLIVAGMLSPALTWADDAAAWGHFSGRFVFDGKPPAPKAISASKDPQCCKNLLDESLLVHPKNGGIKNIVVYLRSKPTRVHPDYAETAADEVALEVRGCRFEPRVLPLRLSQTLVGENFDPVSHNFNLQPIGEAAS